MCSHALKCVCVSVCMFTVLKSCVFRQSEASKGVKKGQWEVDDVLYFVSPVGLVLTGPNVQMYETFEYISKHCLTAVYRGLPCGDSRVE